MKCYGKITTHLRSRRDRGGANPAQAAAGRAAARQALSEAERLFLAASARGATAFQCEDGLTRGQPGTLRPRVTETVLVPKIAGGAVSHHDLDLMTKPG